MMEVVYDAVTNSRFTVVVPDDKAEEVRAFFGDPGVRGHIGALLNEACNAVLTKELGQHFKLTQEGAK